MTEDLARTVRSGPLTPVELGALAANANARKVALWHVLTVERQLGEDAVADALSEVLGLTRVRIDAVHIQREALKVLTPRVARQYVCLPLEINARNVTLAMANPQDVYAIDAVQFSSSRRVQPVVACRREILDGIDKHYPQVSASAHAVDSELVAFAGADEALDLDRDDATQPAEAAAIVSMCHDILFAAV